MAQPPPPMSDADALAMLDWYRAAGVDVAVGDEPVDRFATSAVAPPKRSLPVAGGAAAAPAPTPAVPLTINPDETRAIAAAAPTLEALRAAMDAYDGCALKHRATQLVFADGNPQSRLMLIGEAPGAEEDRQGLPFVGRSGQLLDRMLAAIGLDRTKVYIANIVPWRPPGNRTPTPQEAAVCQPFIERQIALADPDILVCLGGPSAQALLGTKDGILKSRGRWTTYDTGSRRVRAIATLHPAYLLRQPLQKRLAWRDFKAIRAALAQEPQG